MLVNKQLPCRADPSTIPKHIPLHCDGSHGCLGGCGLHNEELAPRSVRNHLMPRQNIQENQVWLLLHRLYWRTRFLPHQQEPLKCHV